MAKKGLDSYPKEFLDMWQLALAGKLSIKMDSRGSLINLRSRMYAFRKRLDETNPVMAAPFKDLDITMPQPVAEGGYEIHAAVLTWKAQVREAMMGGSLPQPAAPSAPLSIPPIPSTPVEIPPLPPAVDHVDSTLQSLGFGTEPTDKDGSINS